MAGETEAQTGETNPAARSCLGPPPHFPPRRQRGRDGAGDNRGPHRGPGSRPQAASPSARASSGCSPPRTPARRWLTAPCGAAGERARGRAGPGRGRSCGAAAEARDARAGGDPVTLARARTRTRTRAHPLALPHAADVPFLNLRNVFLCASERASERARRGRGGGSARARQVTPLPPGPPPPRRSRPAPPPMESRPAPPPSRGPRAAASRRRPAGLIWRGRRLAPGRNEILYRDAFLVMLPVPLGGRKRHAPVGQMRNGPSAEAVRPISHRGAGGAGARTPSGGRKAPAEIRISGPRPLDPGSGAAWFGQSGAGACLFVLPSVRPSIRGRLCGGPQLGNNSRQVWPGRVLPPRTWRSAHNTRSTVCEMNGC